jgi:hypothetical protein
MKKGNRSTQSGKASDLLNTRSELLPQRNRKLQFETKTKPSRRLFATQGALFVGIDAAGRICDGQLPAHDLTVIVRRPYVTS